MHIGQDFLDIYQGLFRDDTEIKGGREGAPSPRVKERKTERVRVWKRERERARVKESKTDSVCV